MNEPFLVALAKPEPAPGGGAAAAYSACLGIALLKKIIHLELLRSDLPPESKDVFEDLLDQADVSADLLEKLLHEDAKAYPEFTEARANGSEEKLRAAMERLIAVPAEIMEKSCEGHAFISEAGKHCKKHLVSDLLVASEFFLAATLGAYHIARANLRLVPRSKDVMKKDSVDRIKRLQNCCKDSHEMVREQLKARIRKGK